jgi:hypothetical protein
MFLRLLFTQSYGLSYVKQILSGVKIKMIQQKQDTTIFHLYSKAANTQ